MSRDERSHPVGNRRQHRHGIDLLATVHVSRRLVVADSDQYRAGARCAVVFEKAPHDEDAGVGGRQVQEITLRLARMKLDFKAFATPAIAGRIGRLGLALARRPRRRVAGFRIVCRLNRGGLPAFVDPPVNQRYALDDHVDGPSKRRHRVGERSVARNENMWRKSYMDASVRKGRSANIERVARAANPRERRLACDGEGW